MATTRDPVLRWAGYAQAAHRKYPDVPVAVLLGLTRVESGGVPGRTSSANAGGLTQFVPGTAATYGVNVAPGHERSQLEGAAHYLHDLGYGKDPHLALAKYNAGPGNPGAAGDYPQKVLAAARHYGHLGNLPASPAGTTSTPDAAPASPSDGALVDDAKKSGALKALLTVTTVAAGAALVYMGANNASGGRVGGAVKTGAKVAAL